MYFIYQKLHKYLGPFYVTSVMTFYVTLYASYILSKKANSIKHSFLHHSLRGTCAVKLPPPPPPHLTVSRWGWVVGSNQIESPKPFEAEHFFASFCGQNQFKVFFFHYNPKGDGKGGEHHGSIYCHLYNVSVDTF